MLYAGTLNAPETHWNIFYVFDELEVNTSLKHGGQREEKVIFRVWRT
jgi:hypothetical protein